MFGDEKRNAFIQRDIVRSRFVDQNRHAHFQFGRLDRDGQAPAKSRYQTIIDVGQFFGEAVAGNDDLFVSFD